MDTMFKNNRLRLYLKFYDIVVDINNEINPSLVAELIETGGDLIIFNHMKLINNLYE